MCSSKRPPADLLAFLMERAEHAVSRTTLYADVWGIQFDPGTEVLGVQLTYLRKVLLALGCNVRIHTHLGIGLRLHAQAYGSLP